VLACDELTVWWHVCVWRVHRWCFRLGFFDATSHNRALWAEVVGATSSEGFPVSRRTLSHMQAPVDVDTTQVLIAVLCLDERWQWWQLGAAAENLFSLCFINVLGTCRLDASTAKSGADRVVNRRRRLNTRPFRLKDHDVLCAVRCPVGRSKLADSSLHNCPQHFSNYYYSKTGRWWTACYRPFWESLFKRNEYIR